MQQILFQSEIPASICCKPRANVQALEEAQVSAISATRTKAEDWARIRLTPTITF